MGESASVPVTLDRLRVIASSTRFRILRTLAERRHTVSELAKALDASKGAIHKHLRKLVQADFVRRDEDEERVWVYYELTRKGERLASADRPTITIQLGVSAVSTLGAALAAAYAAVLWTAGPTGGDVVGPGGGTATTGGRTSLLADPLLWAGLAAVLAVVAVAVVWRLRRGPATG